MRPALEPVYRPALYCLAAWPPATFCGKLCLSAVGSRRRGGGQLSAGLARTSRVGTSSPRHIPSSRAPPCRAPCRAPCHTLCLATCNALGKDPAAAQCMSLITKPTTSAFLRAQKLLSSPIKCQLALSFLWDFCTHFVGRHQLIASPAAADMVSQVPVWSWWWGGCHLGPGSTVREGSAGPFCKKHIKIMLKLA